jgi:hypothetical protein
MNRRQFFSAAGLGVAAAAGEASAAQSSGESAPLEAVSLSESVDFRYSPLSFQSAYCFPDDPFKSLIGEHGDLRYGNPGAGKALEYFTTVVEFSLLGMEADQVVRQQLEAPSVPIVHTYLARPEAELHLIAFATNEDNEGRVDNVILEVTPRLETRVQAGPVITLRTKERFVAVSREGRTVVHPEGHPETPFLILDAAAHVDDVGFGYRIVLPVHRASGDRPLRYVARFPQQQQSESKVKTSLGAAGALLASSRQYWRNWQPFGKDISWQLPAPYNEFLLACTRNILQAREVKKGQLTFQVGPTVYRSLFVVDGHFLLEAARYLGYDAEAQKGLETTWSYQNAEGGVFAGAGESHWKDTAIAMFSLVRQAELSQDWSYFKAMQPNVLKGVAFLARLVERAKKEGSANGTYGVLARGMSDGGVGGIRSELSNTVWVLAGLKATIEAADRLHLTGYEPVRKFYTELRQGFNRAAAAEMRHHADGFDFLPILMKEDKAWADPDEWNRPRLQAAQWAMSHAIYPGLVFDKNDPIVQGHVRLMQAVTQEDVPAETGWLPHQGLWTYNAPFVAHVYLWANQPEWARRVFQGFLNHATPLYCWREEQPLRHSLVCSYVGDMPHNWASAECVLFLRHMLALEDGEDLRLLAAFGDQEAGSDHPYTLVNSPTRFGRIGLNLTPVGRGRGWRLEFQRDQGPAPKRIVVPARAGSRFTQVEVRGAGFTRAGDSLLIDPAASSWSANWSL